MNNIKSVFFIEKRLSLNVGLIEIAKGSFEFSAISDAAFVCGHVNTTFGFWFIVMHCYFMCILIVI